MAGEKCIRCGNLRFGNTSEVTEQIGVQKDKSGDESFRNDLKNSIDQTYVQIYHQLCQVDDLFAKECKVYKSCRKRAYNLNKNRVASADKSAIPSSSKSLESSLQTTTTLKRDKISQQKNKQKVIDYVENEVIALNLVASIDDIVQVYYEDAAEDKKQQQNRRAYVKSLLEGHYKNNELQIISVYKQKSVVFGVKSIAKNLTGPSNHVNITNLRSMCVNYIHQ